METSLKTAIKDHPGKFRSDFSTMNYVIFVLFIPVFQCGLITSIDLFCSVLSTIVCLFFFYFLSIILFQTYQTLLTTCLTFGQRA